MKCEPTLTTPLEESTIAALPEYYRQERDKRVNPKGTNQYVQAKGEFEEVYEADPHMPVLARLPVHEDLDVAVLGAGWTGLLAAYHLKKAGVSTFRTIDHAGGWGGVWYWNRYPGLQCDNDAYCYVPLLEETGFMPTKKFADGYEIRGYMNQISERYELGHDALFHTRVTGLRWDAAISRWRVSTDRHDDIRARFVVMANGLLNIPKLPGIPGIADFKGKMFHTGRWDYDYTGGTQTEPLLDKLADKTVAIIATGATGIQAVPSLGTYAKQLYVLQRTPSTVDKRVNPPTDQEWVKSLQPGWQKLRKQNFHSAAMESFRPGEPDMICDIWTEISGKLAAELAAEGWPQLSLEEFMARRENVDYRVMERLHARVEDLVQDKETAEALKPWYRFLCKRPASNNDFYPAFNRTNVKLIDVSSSRGVERLTETGFVVNGREYEIDCVIFASGFEVSSSLERRWGIEKIEGRYGVSLYDHWRDGYSSLHGISAPGFPNMLFTGDVQSALNSSTTEQMSRHNYHVAHIIKQALDRNFIAVEPSCEATAEWTKHVRETAFDNSFLRECTPSYFNGENSEMPKSCAGEPYGPGWDAWENLLENWRLKDDVAGMIITKANAEAAE